MKRALFSILRDATDPNEVGAYPQIQKLGGGDYWRLDVRTRIRIREQAPATPHKPPDLGHLFLERGAKLTDQMSVVPLSGGFLLSPRAASILRAHRLGPCAFCPVRVVDARLRDHQYFFVALGDDPMADARSNADIALVFDRGIARRFSSMRALCVHRDDDATSTPHRVVLPDDLVSARDVYGKLPAPFYGSLVSRALADAIRADGLTGFRILDAPFVVARGSEIETTERYAA